MTSPTPRRSPPRTSPTNGSPSTPCGRVVPQRNAVATYSRAGAAGLSARSLSRKNSLASRRPAAPAHEKLVLRCHFAAEHALDDLVERHARVQHLVDVI